VVDVLLLLVLHLDLLVDRRVQRHLRSDDLGGWAKALWVIFVIVLPYLGVFVSHCARQQDE
jgi:hypothetical protein